MNSDNHALVNWVVWMNKPLATLLELPERVGYRLAIVLADQHAIAALRHRTLTHGLILIENMTHQDSTTRQRHEFALKTNKAASRNTVFQTCTTADIRLHIQQFAFATAEHFHEATLVAD